MENRIDELASVVEWVNDMALEPKWRLGALHAIREEGRNEMIGVRHLGTIRERLRHCMLRRIRRDVLDQLPPRTDTRVPVEMTESQRRSHDELDQPIIILMQKAMVRPLTQAEFLRLMSLLTLQRIICNGLAQLQFEDIWPTIRDRSPDEATLQGLATPKLGELRQLIQQIVARSGAQGRRLQPVAADAHPGALGGPRPAGRKGAPRRLLHGCREPAAADAEHRRVPRRPDRSESCSPAMPAGSG